MQEVNRFEIQKFPERPDAVLMKAKGTPRGVVPGPRDAPTLRGRWRRNTY